MNGRPARQPGIIEGVQISFVIFCRTNVFTFGPDAAVLFCRVLVQVELYHLVPEAQAVLHRSALPALSSDAVEIQPGSSLILSLIHALLCSIFLIRSSRVPSEDAETRVAHAAPPLCAPLPTLLLFLPSTSPPEVMGPEGHGPLHLCMSLCTYKGSPAFWATASWQWHQVYRGGRRGE